VLETLYAVLQLAYRKMDEQAGLSRNIGLARPNSSSSSSPAWT
jgi:hypothetical protein